MRSARGHHVAERPRADVRQRVGPLAGNLCVDPANPAGPAAARPHTRIVEYALDAQEHEATVAWSHRPQSAALSSLVRVVHGLGRPGGQRQHAHRLVGGARALATEVDPNGGVLWRLRREEPHPEPQLISYRASLMQSRDVSDRVVDVVRCPTDRRPRRRAGGGRLPMHRLRRLAPQACAGDLRPGDLLDTSTPGAHTVHLTATDGAGITTTVTRSYTVTATFQPRWTDDRMRAPCAASRPPPGCPL